METDRLLEAELRIFGARAGRRRRLLVLGEPALEDGAREHADEAAVVDDRHALGVVLLDEAERLVERRVGVDRVVGRLGERRRPASRAGSRPSATTRATSVLRVTTPTSAPSASTT